MPDDMQLIRFFARLTERQQDVLYLVSRELTNKQVGERLFIQPSVVAGHLTNIYGEMVAAGLLDENALVSRYTLIRLFGSFFDRNPGFFDTDALA